MNDVYAEVLRTSRGNIRPHRWVTAPYQLETRNWDLIASLRQMGSPDRIIDLRDALRTLTGRQHIFFAPSCRAAIAQVLSLFPHREVVLPAYTCPVVKTAIEIANNKIIYVDIARNGLNATSAEFAEHIKPGRVLIPTHIFGIPTDIEAICNLAQVNDCITIEDAAPAFGGKVNNQPLGTFGDVGIYSFEKSKRIPAFRGAAIVINNENVIDPAKLEAAQIIETQQEMPLRELAFAILFNSVTPPWLYGRVTLPLLLQKYLWQKTSLYDTNPESEKISPYYTRDFHPYQAELILRQLKRFEKIRLKISEQVSVYRKALSGTSIMTFDTSNGDDGGLLKFPIAFPGRKRSEILHSALNKDIFLEVIYTRPLPEEKELSKYPNAAWAASNLVLLPLYSRLSLGDVERIAKEITRL